MSKIEEYLKVCIARIESNFHEISADGTLGKEISLLARSALPNPALEEAEVLVSLLEIFIQEHPVEGYSFEFFLKVQGGRAAIMMRYFKINYG